MPNSTKNIIEFDSSADRAIAQAYGFEHGSIELREREESCERYKVFDVYARNLRATPTSPAMPLQLRGRLCCMTRPALQARLDSGDVYSRRFPPTHMETVDSTARVLAQARRRERAAS